jgi:hypothetical protein
MAPAAAELTPPPFTLSYSDAGLTEILIKDAKLHYVWHTDRHFEDSKLVALGSLENYDRHQIDVWLTDTELQRFRNWVAQHQVFKFEKEYPSPSGGSSRGAAFRSALTVSDGNHTHSVFWVGDSKVPIGLGTATDALRSCAADIEKSRSK